VNTREPLAHRRSPRRTASLLLLAAIPLWLLFSTTSTPVGHAAQPPADTAQDPTAPPADVTLDASQPTTSPTETDTDRPPVMPPPPVIPEAGDTAAIEKDGAPEPSAELQPTDTAPAAQPTTAATTPTPKDSFGLWSLTPAIVAIILAIVTRQVLVALSIGILTGAAMMACLAGTYNPIGWLTTAIDVYLYRTLVPVADSAAEFDKLQVLFFTLMIGAMVGTIEAAGGTRAMVARVTRHMKTRQRGQLGAFFAGLVVFFDDYANAMIVGPSMRPVFDRLRLSREKLAYIVDSTAAPVASLFIGTWLATEIQYIDVGLDALGDARPGFLADMSASKAFWASIPYRTYAWLALVMVFLVAVSGRDLGTMRKAESDAVRTPAAGGATDAEDNGDRWLIGLLPVAMLVFLTIGLMITTGVATCRAEGIDLAWKSRAAIGESIMDILAKCDSYIALQYGSLAAAVLAVIMSVGGRALSLAKAMDAFLNGMSRMFAACVVLILAWGLSQVSQDLQLGEVARERLQHLIDEGLFGHAFLPLAIFLTAAFVSFATGTSWGTLGIICPATVTIAAGLLADMPAQQAMPLFYASVGAVLTGAVFGDHCSPISDTTVLSSIASECDLGAHVWTQLPYAIIVALAGILCTDILNVVLMEHAPTFYNKYWNVYYGTACGALVLAMILLVAGRRPRGIVSEPAIETGE